MELLHYRISKTFLTILDEIPANWSQNQPQPTRKPQGDLIYVLDIDTKLHLMVRLQVWKSRECGATLHCPYLPTPLLGQGMTQGQFLSGV